MTDTNKEALPAKINPSDYVIVLASEGVTYADGHFSVIPKPLKYAKEISSDAKILWEIINDYAGSNRKAFPSHARLAEDMGKSTRQVKRYVEELVSQGWLTVQNRIGYTSYYYCAVPGEHYKTFNDPAIEGNYKPQLVRRSLPELPPGQ
ncbi:helix-turn-helix domain-containing protein [Streptomyces sp. NPDC059680]|uniref:helix-turn-helix domain-containing protein n=1 Tax=Streptomyces sp. NPDC059680 TaxID=3346904 RepID=UPI0036B146D5